MTPRLSKPWETSRPCRDEGCDVRVLLARLADSRRWLAFEAQDRPPFTDAAVDCRVLIDGLAWRLPDLIEHLRAYRGLTEAEARDFAAGHPWHRAHTHTN